ncbi:MAG TPA: hypothetical protein VEG27_10260 [Usitatibacter sp.]|nr:hypothetical protein [Usitatibacter sp.]
MKTDERAAALLGLIEADRAARCGDALDAAQRQARALLGMARGAARSRVHAAVAEERAAFAARAASAEARVGTARRMAQQRRLKRLVARAWEEIPRSLAARWEDGAARRAWTEAALEVALAALPAGKWEVDAPPSWPLPEREAALARLAARGIEAVATDAQDIAAGLRVRSASAVLDATLPGLVGDRLAIEGRLLELLEEGAP